MDGAARRNYGCEDFLAAARYFRHRERTALAVAGADPAIVASLSMRTDVLEAAGPPGAQPHGTDTRAR